MNYDHSACMPFYSACHGPRTFCKTRPPAAPRVSVCTCIILSFVVKVKRGTHAHSKDYHVIVTHMNLAEEMRNLVDKVGIAMQEIKDHKQLELTPAVIADVCHLNRVVERENELHESLKAALQNVMERKNSKTYIDHMVNQKSLARTLCDDIGKADVKRENFRYREVLHKLNLVHLGTPDGGDWHAGMPAAKPGKSRTWAVYLGHASETILKCKEVSDLDESISSTEKATCKSWRRSTCNRVIWPFGCSYMCPISSTVFWGAPNANILFCRFLNELIFCTWFL